MLFRDRTDAGRRLAEELADYAGRRDVLVLALPRGGVTVAYEVAEKLGGAAGDGGRHRARTSKPVKP